MKKQEIGLGFVLVAIAIGFFFLTNTLPEDSALFPRLVAFLLMGLSGIFLMGTIRSKETDETSPFDKVYWRQLLFIVGLSFVYIILIQVFGYFAATGLYIVVGTMGLRIPFKSAAISATGTVAFLYLVFVVFLNVPLPKGFLL